MIELRWLEVPAGQYRGVGGVCDESSRTVRELQYRVSVVVDESGRFCLGRKGRWLTIPTVREEPSNGTS